jgi:sugar lactone lactonase YvrE
MNKAGKVVKLLFGMMGCLLLVNPFQARADIIYVANGYSDTIEEFTSCGSGSLFADVGLSGPGGVAFDRAGNLYVAEYGGNLIHKLSTNGVQTVFASTGLDEPVGLAFDSRGNLYAANYGNNTVEKFGTNGVGTVFTTNDLYEPTGLAFDTNGNLYVADYYTSGVVRFDTNGIASVFVPNYSTVVGPTGLAFDKSGNLYVSSLGNNTIEKFNTNGVGSVFANAGLNEPVGLAFDSIGNLYVANFGSNSVVRFTTNGVGSVFATNSLDGPVSIAVQWSPGSSCPSLILGCPTNPPCTNINGQCYLITNTNIVYGGGGAGVIPFGVPLSVSTNAMYFPYTLTRQTYPPRDSPALGSVDFGGGPSTWLSNLVSGCGCSITNGEEIPILPTNPDLLMAFEERLVTNSYVVMPVVTNWQSSVITVSGFISARILSIGGSPGAPTITLENVPSCGMQVPPADDGSVPVLNACGGTFTVTHDPDVITNQTCPRQYTIVRTYHATDTCGNTGSISQIITVNDTTPPFIDCPSTVTVNVDPGKCTASNVNLGSPTAGSSCAGSVALANNAPAVFSKGTTVVTWTATDPCGNKATCAQSVVVVDNQAPTISCPAPVTVSCASAVPPVNTGSVTASDNCGSVTVSFVGDITTNQTCANRYTVLRTYRATDASGNSATCTQTITVNDTTPPTITAPSDVTTFTDPGQCSASNVALGSPTASSFCGDAVTVTNNAPAVFPKGITQVIWSATDSCGNSAAATQNVLVVDNQPPAIVCPGNILASAVDSNGATVTFLVTATDNCDSNLTVNCSPVSGSEFAVGTTPVNCAVVDSSGNSNTCSFSVTVVDASVFNILSITPQGSDIQLSWIMPLGFTGVVQGTAGAGDGSYSSNFTDVSSPFYAPGDGISTNTYLDAGALTNSPFWYYRIRLVP